MDETEFFRKVDSRVRNDQREHTGDLEGKDDEEEKRRRLFDIDCNGVGVYEVHTGISMPYACLEKITSLYFVRTLA
ncbi:hypothetical protein PHET_04636 [Paragonimus heterotremus]|uniref:Uncharacterized protein n=1 Tax=Paragonimus heterotremus TaxID=100268 RepID=A0A8J4WIL8_9TREM|nr:hypothetical protein PHET_04636 [Paragonimus heterotremus]